jgi:hypothetical protein
VEKILLAGDRVADMLRKVSPDAIDEVALELSTVCVSHIKKTREQLPKRDVVSSCSDSESCNYDYQEFML